MIRLIEEDWGHERATSLARFAVSSSWVAVFGASATPGSVGNILMRNLLENPSGGVIFPVTPKRRAVQGAHCYPNLAAVPGKVELAVIATPAATVPNLVRD